MSEWRVLEFGWPRCVKCDGAMPPVLHEVGFRLHPCCDVRGAERWCRGCRRAHPGGCSCARPRLWPPAAGAV